MIPMKKMPRQYMFLDLRRYQNRKKGTVVKSPKT